MARRTPRNRQSGSSGHGWLWWLTWPIHVVPRWACWLAYQFIDSTCQGLVQGIRIAYWECKAASTVKKCRENGTYIYDLEIWQLLRSIAFDKQRNRQGVVVCSGCKEPTHNPHCHHIKHVAHHPELAFTLSNLTGVCAFCHQEEHPDVVLAPGVRRSPKLRGLHRRRHRRAA